MSEDNELLSNSYSHLPDRRERTPEPDEKRESRYNKDLEKTPPKNNNSYKADGSHIDKKVEKIEVQNQLKKN